MSEKVLSWDYTRRFGLEIELNALDGRDFVTDPLLQGELPYGINYIGNIVKEVTKKPVYLDKWHYTHNNEIWVLKPDRSCGIEVCTPAVKGWYGLNQVCRVIDAFMLDSKAIADSRCSLHVHVEVADCSARELASILAWWIKCEPVFLDSVPDNRKFNKFCQSIGTTNMFYSEDYTSSSLFDILSIHKYFTLNTYHMSKGKRKTIEFRTLGEEGCKNSYITRNWIRLLIHFVEMAKNKLCPRRYKVDNPMTGLLWLDLLDVMKILGFYGNYRLSKGMEELRNWFIYRIKSNVETKRDGLWSNEFRKITSVQLGQIMDKLRLTDEDIKPVPESMYCNEYRN